MDDLETKLYVEAPTAEQRKLLKAVREFDDYIISNPQFIPNYGERYRQVEPIWTAFIESAAAGVQIPDPPSKGVIVTTKKNLAPRRNVIRFHNHRDTKSFVLRGNIR